MNNEPAVPTAAEDRLAKHTRRGLLTMVVGAAAAIGGWSWARSRPEVGGLASPFRSALRVNESLAKAYFSNSHLAPTFPQDRVDTETRVNGDVGLGPDFDLTGWHLKVAASQQLSLSLADIRNLPRVEQSTQLNCIEGWTVIVHWAGARFADFARKYAPQSIGDHYVHMQTPDEEYYVGLDMASAMHPQTLLCYEMNGAPLTSEHGAPLRLVIPVKYGVKNLKRIGTITFTNDRPNDYWADRGYDWYAGL